MSITKEERQDIVRMQYLCELIAVQGENLAKSLRELADISERCGVFTLESKSLTSVRNFADTIASLKTFAYTEGGAE